MSKEPLTHSDRYIRKSNRIILIIGIVFLFLFLFGLMLIDAGGEEEQEQEDVGIDSIQAETDFGVENKTNNEAEIEFDDAEEVEKPITLTPNPVEIGQVILGENREPAKNVLTIGTNGKSAIKIVSVELEDAPAEGFSIDVKDCEGKELRGKITCMVTTSWLPTMVANMQNNIKII